MDNTFYKPTLEDVVFTTDDYIIGKNFEAKYWKCFHEHNVIYPIDQILHKYTANCKNKHHPDILAKLLREQIDNFIKLHLNTE